ncbi:hypothetical protein ILYODFUR_021937 [Ilyodon furcidens]|uniref:Uncharacterized protein n=1 Tax=Ilyodon furcidens TaxID=33524 RepID=A0ABV0TDI4_9TELE
MENRLSFQFQRGSRTNRLRLQSPKDSATDLPGSAADLQGVSADLQGVIVGSSGFCTTLLSSTMVPGLLSYTVLTSLFVGSPGPAAGLLTSLFVGSLGSSQTA